MVFEYFKDKVYCTIHKITFLSNSKCIKCYNESIQTTLTNNSLTNTNNSRRVYVRKNIVERFHSYRMKFEAEVEWSHLFSYEEFTLNNNVKFKRIDFPEAIVRVFRKSILITLRSSQEIKGLPVKEAKVRSDELIKVVLDKLPKAIKVKDKGNVSSVHNAFVDHPTAKVFKEAFNREMCVKDDEGKVILITDNSHHNRELEYIKADIVVDKSVEREEYEKDLIEQPIYKPSDVRYAIDKLIQDREYYAENLKSHVQAIQDLSKGVNELREQVRKNKVNDFIERFK